MQKGYSVTKKYLFFQKKIIITLDVICKLRNIFVIIIYGVMRESPSWSKLENLLATASKLKIWWKFLLHLTVVSDTVCVNSHVVSQLSQGAGLPSGLTRKQHAGTAKPERQKLQEISYEFKSRLLVVSH